MNTNVEKKQLQPVDNGYQNLIALAIEKGSPIEQLEKLMALKERYDAQQANKTFIAALSSFQSQVPPIPKSKQVGYTSKSGGTTSYKYAELGDIDETIKSHMAANGLSKRWEISEEGERIIVTCIISHVDGHTEKTTMSSLKDTSGNKNEIQSRASAISYMQRYTLIGALGLTTASEDNDGDGTLSLHQTPNTVNGHQQPIQHSVNQELPWLNFRDKQGNITSQGIEIKKELETGLTTIDKLKTIYRISKATADELGAIKVTGAFVIPGNWLAKVEKWKTVDDAITTYNFNKETINATPDLQQFFFQETMKMCKSKADVLTVYNAAKETINATPDLQQILKEKQSNYSPQKV